MTGKGQDDQGRVSILLRPSAWSISVYWSSWPAMLMRQANCGASSNQRTSDLGGEAHLLLAME
jgi:hypothetical protein